MAKRRERKPLADPWVIRSLALAEDMIRYVGQDPRTFPDESFDALGHARWLMARIRDYLTHNLTLPTLAKDYRDLAEMYMPLIRRATPWR